MFPLIDNASAFTWTSFGTRITLSVKRSGRAAGRDRESEVALGGVRPGHSRDRRRDAGQNAGILRGRCSAHDRGVEPVTGLDLARVAPRSAGRPPGREADVFHVRRRSTADLFGFQCPGVESDLVDLALEVAVGLGEVGCCESDPVDAIRERLSRREPLFRFATAVDEEGRQCD